eukprot:89182_1
MIAISVIIISLIFNERTFATEDKQVLNPSGCKDNTFSSGKTVILDDDSVNLIRCQTIGKANYMINFNIRSRSTQFHLYFTTGSKCETADMEYDTDIIADWDEDPTTARSSNEFYAERDDSHIFGGETAQRSVSVTNYLLTPKVTNEWFCFMIKDDQWNTHSKNAVTIQYLFQPESTIWSNTIMYSKPVEKIAIKGIGLDQDKILNVPITRCCRMTKTKDSQTGEKIECQFIDFDETGTDAFVKFKYPIINEGFLQIGIGMKSKDSDCPANWTMVAQITGFNIMNLLNHPKYGPLIIGCCVVVILLICWCIQQCQRQRMMAMMMQPRNK